LTLGYDESDLLVEWGVPTIRLEESAYRTYTADIFIPHENLLIDVKSSWTYVLAAEGNFKGARAAKFGGYHFAYLIMGPKIEPKWVF
jgi:hypothetical protein